MRFPRGLIALALALTLSGVHFSDICAGWDSSAAARHSCCVGMGHECGGGTVDQCCAAGEQREHGEAAAPAVVLSVPAMPAVMLPPAAVARVRPAAAVVADRASAHRHLLLSVFLI